MQKQQQIPNTKISYTKQQQLYDVNQKQKQSKQLNQVPPTIQSTSKIVQTNENKSNQQEQQIFEKICKYLQQKNIQYKIIQHQATRTSQQSANVRNTPLEWGSKTMLVNGNENNLILLIYRAHMRISWKKIRKIQQIGKKAQMATQDEVRKLGVKPGGVPPFPSMIGLKGVIDCKFKNFDTMAFNAGHLCKSIVMRTQDFPLDNISIGDMTQD